MSYRRPTEAERQAIREARYGPATEAAQTFERLVLEWLGDFQKDVIAQCGDKIDTQLFRAHMLGAQHSLKSYALMFGNSLASESFENALSIFGDIWWNAFIAGNNIGVDMVRKPFRDGGLRTSERNLAKRRSRTEAWQNTAFAQAELILGRNRHLTQEDLATKVLEKCQAINPAIAMPGHKHLVGFISAKEKSGELKGRLRSTH